MAMEVDQRNDSGAATKIMVIGVGGGGGNAVKRIVDTEVAGAEFAIANTDAQVLKHSGIEYKIQLGEKLTKGQGAGGDPEIGEKAALESEDKISDILKGTDMLFITAGMGGGTGTGAAPVIARIGKEKNILTVGVVTRPFDFEGEVRAEIAQKGIEELAQNVDSLIVIPNEKLNELPEYEDLPMMESFHMADDVLATAVKNISTLITEQGYINLDFADIKNIMKDAGIAHIGFATASGKDKALTAAKAAVQSPLLETSINGAQKIILYYRSSKDISTKAVKEATNYVKNLAAQRAHIIVGMNFVEDLEDTVELTLIAADFLDYVEDKKDNEVKLDFSSQTEVQAEAQTEDNSQEKKYDFSEIGDLASKYTVEDGENSKDANKDDDDDFSPLITDAFKNNRFN